MVKETNHKNLELQFSQRAKNFFVTASTVPNNECSSFLHFSQSAKNFYPRRFTHAFQTAKTCFSVFTMSQVYCCNACHNMTSNLFDVDFEGLKECHVVSHDESLLVAELLQNARHDVGYLLEADMQKGPMTCQ